MLPQMVRLWKKEEAVRIRYKAYDSPEEWKAELLDKPDLTRDAFCLYGFRQPGRGLQRQSARRNSCWDKTTNIAERLYIPSEGKEEYEGTGVGSSLLEKRKHFLKDQEKT